MVSPVHFSKNSLTSSPLLFMYQALDVLTQGCLDFLVADVTHAYFFKSNVSVKVTFVAQMLEGKISVWSVSSGASLQGKTKDLFKAWTELSKSPQGH